MSFDEVKSISYAGYVLTAKANLNSKFQGKNRIGALLRVEFENQAMGYADCCPLEELGDLSVSSQLNLLSQKKCTKITKKSILFSKRNAFQNQKQNKIGKDIFLRNHMIIPYEKLDEKELLKIHQSGFNFIKLKFGLNLEKEIDFIKNHAYLLKKINLKLRLDFNSVLCFGQAKKFFSQIENQTECLDFIEDPMEFDFTRWAYLQDTYGISLALDRKMDLQKCSLFLDKSEQAFKVVIIKPALEDGFDLLHLFPRQRFVFTSYMDHPVGQVCALSEAFNFYQAFPDKQEDCGFLTNTLFQENEYSRLLQVHDTILTNTDGLYSEFYPLFERENWIPLIK